MLANQRLRLLSSFFLTLLFAAGPVQAQVHGASAPPTSTVSSVGNVNPAPGAANLASLGANGYSNVLQPFLGNCCAKYFLPRHTPPPPPQPPLGSGQHGGPVVVPIAVPVYVPYAVGYVADAGDETAAPAPDTSGEADPSPAQQRQAAIGEDVGGGSDNEDWTDIAASEEPGVPIVPQPATVLIFKDGHRSDVKNYAIVGDTLFNFADDGRTMKIQLADLDLAATKKANDAAGVEFRLPAAGQ